MWSLLTCWCHSPKNFWIAFVLLRVWCWSSNLFSGIFTFCPERCLSYVAASDVMCCSRSVWFDLGSLFQGCLSLLEGRVVWHKPVLLVELFVETSLTKTFSSVVEALVSLGVFWESSHFGLSRSALKYLSSVCKGFLLGSNLVYVTCLLSNAQIGRHCLILEQILWKAFCQGWCTIVELLAGRGILQHGMHSCAPR